MYKIRFVRVVILMSLVLVGLASGAQAQSPVVAAPAPADPLAAPAGAPAAGLPNCRYGVGAAGATQASWLPTVGAGWYLDFTVHAPLPSSNAQFAQMLWVRQNKDGCDYLDGYTIWPSLTDAALGPIIAGHPGALWIVGNEPDRGPTPGLDCNNSGQGDMYPEVYARVYHDAYYFIKHRDPTAKIAVAGLVEVTPGRLQYWDLVWKAYHDIYGERMPVDVWNMHLYALPELLQDGSTPSGAATIALGTDPALGIRSSGNNPNACADPQVYCWAEHDSLAVFEQQVVAMRTWMKQHDEQDKPLILAEYSQLYPFVDYDDPINPTQCYLMDEYDQCWTEARVKQFMQRSFNYLESAIDVNLGYPRDQYRLVQRWVWYTMNTQGTESPGYVSNIITDDLSALTGVGRTFRDYVAGVSQYVNLQPDSVWGSPLLPGSATIRATVVNLGNVQTTTPFRVTFYADSGLTQPIGTVQLQNAVAGCMSQSLTAAVTWSGLTASTHQFWVKVDSDDALTESNESDNVGTGFVTVYAHGTLLPLILR